MTDVALNGWGVDECVNISNDSVLQCTGPYLPSPYKRCFRGKTLKYNKTSKKARQNADGISSEPSI